MSIELLAECAIEVRRLSIAGSFLAINDYRLKRLIEPLKTAGKKAAVFNKIASAAEALTQGSEQESAENLLTLATLLYAVLYTQGQTSITGELTPLDNIDVGMGSKPASYRTLKPLLESLTTSGSGRLEIIRNAYQNGLFQDIRLIQPAIRAINDPYTEVAEFMAEKVLPDYGPAILPLLPELNIKGGTAEGRLLKLIYKLDQATGWRFITDAMGTGSAPLKLAAVECLGGSSPDPDYALSLLLKHTKDRKTDVRIAAIRALGAYGADKRVSELLLAILQGDNDRSQRSAAVHSIQQINSPELWKELRYITENLLISIIESGKADNMTFSSLVDMFTCFEFKYDAETEALLLSCYERMKKCRKLKTEGTYSSKDLVAKIAMMLLLQGTSAAYDALLQDHEQLEPDILMYAFNAALNSRDPAWVYDQFSGYFFSPSGKQGAAKTKKLMTLFNSGGQFNYFVSPSQKEFVLEWDSRWIKSAIQADNTLMVLCLISPKDTEAVEYLRKQYAKAKYQDKPEILAGFIRANVSDGVQLLIETLEKLNPHKHYSERYYLLRLIDKLPLESLAELEKLAGRLPEDSADKVLERIAMRRKS